MYSEILILLVLLVLSAITSSSETALISVSPSKVDELVSSKARNSKILQKLKRDVHKLLTTVLIVNNVINIGASAYAAIVFTRMFGDSGVGIATGVMTFLILIFGEITPKSFAHQRAVGVSLLVARPVYYIQILLYPLVWLFGVIAKGIGNLMGASGSHTVTEGEVVAMLKIGAQEGSIEKHERELIENVFEFNDIQVGEIMTPRVAVEAIDSEMTIQEAVDFVIKNSHTRIPVYRDNIDNIIGIISVRELLKYFDNHSPKKKLKSLKFTPPLEVPIFKKINTLFREFQRKHVHIAIVIDEHGGTAGLVTMEDILEEIVGDIVDEFDVHEKPIEIIDSKTVIARGNALVEDINDFFRIKFGPGENDTISSMLTEYLQRFPREGETIKLPRAKVLIIKMKKHLVDKVKITKTANKVKS